jgi:hypothetical protein
VDRATSGLRFKLPVARALPPMTQGTRRNADATSRLWTSDTKPGHPITEAESYLAGLMFGLTKFSLAVRATTAGWWGRRFGFGDRHLDGQVVTWAGGVCVLHDAAGSAGLCGGRFF